MKTTKVINHITSWLKKYANSCNMRGFVIGISGGIDSAVTSTLAAKTGLKLICLEMPIHQNKIQVERAQKHINWLQEKFDNIISEKIELSSIFEEFKKKIPKKEKHELALVNTRARLRMTTLYYYAQTYNYLVLGTGNKVEDFGIGFFTKYGDGGVDISPIADLLKSEVYNIAQKLAIHDDIISAPPTDGLWGDDKTDEQQIGANYSELEWAMNFKGNEHILSDRKKEVLRIYNRLNQKNQHKMNAIPVCIIPKDLL